MKNFTLTGNKTHYLSNHVHGCANAQPSRAFAPAGRAARDGALRRYLVNVSMRQFVATLLKIIMAWSSRFRPEPTIRNVRQKVGVGFSTSRYHGHVRLVHAPRRRATLIAPTIFLAERTPPRTSIVRQRYHAGSHVKRTAHSTRPRNDPGMARVQHVPPSKTCYPIIWHIRLTAAAL